MDKVLTPSMPTQQLLREWLPLCFFVCCNSSVSLRLWGQAKASNLQRSRSRLSTSDPYHRFEQRLLRNILSSMITSFEPSLTVRFEKSALQYSRSFCAMTKCRYRRPRRPSLESCASIRALVPVASPGGAAVGPPAVFGRLGNACTPKNCRARRAAYSTPVAPPMAYRL